MAAVTPDGATVYAAGFFTGNRTTAVHERLVSNSHGVAPPLIKAGGMATPFSLPDRDAFAINATANPPAVKQGTAGSEVDPVFRTTPRLIKRDSSRVIGAVHGEAKCKEIRAGI
jgi:hypothetical protein